MGQALCKISNFTNAYVPLENAFEHKRAKDSMKVF